MLIKLILIIVSKYTYIANLYIIYLKLIVLYVTCISIFKKIENI